jgi:hypothetical protein
LTFQPITIQELTRFGFPRAEKSSTARLLWQAHSHFFPSWACKETWLSPTNPHNEQRRTLRFRYSARARVGGPSLGSSRRAANAFSCLSEGHTSHASTREGLASMKSTRSTCSNVQIPIVAIAHFSGQRKILLKNRAQSLYKSRSLVGKKARASLSFSDPDGHLIEFITSSVGSINLLRAESSRSPVAIHRSPLSAERASSAPWHRGRESVRRPDRRAWRRGDSLRAKGRVASRSECTTCRSGGAGQAAAACQEAADGLALPRSAA